MDTKEIYNQYQLLVGEAMHIIRFPHPSKIEVNGMTGQIKVVSDTIISENGGVEKTTYAVFSSEVNIFKQEQ